MQQQRGTHPGSARQWWRCPTASSGPAGACARSAGKAQGAADVRASGSNSARRGGIWAAQTRSEAPSARHASPHVADCPGRPPRIRSAAVAAQHLHLQCLGCFPIRRSGMRATQRPRRRGQRVCSQRPGSPARRGDARKPRRALSGAGRGWWAGQAWAPRERTAPATAARRMTAFMAATGAAKELRTGTGMRRVSDEIGARCPTELYYVRHGGTCGVLTARGVRWAAPAHTVSVAHRSAAAARLHP